MTSTAAQIARMAGRGLGREGRDPVTSPVPFSPIPTEHCEVKFRAEDEWTYGASPMRVLWEQNYRDAAHEMLGYVSEESAERAKRLARTGRDMEDAYLTRVGAEARANRVAVDA